MKATGILEQEHRVILRVVACLERAVESGTARGRLDGASARKAIEFFCTFADICHHRKEEDCLFPKLIERGFAANGGRIAIMLSEHDIERGAIRGMIDTLDGAAAGEAADLRAFGDWTERYARLVRNHIEKEDHILFPLAARLLTGLDERAVLAGFDAAESEEAGTHARMLALADELCRRFGVDTENSDPLTCTSHAL